MVAPGTAHGPLYPGAINPFLGTSPSLTFRPKLVTKFSASELRSQTRTTKTEPECSLLRNRVLPPRAPVKRRHVAWGEDAGRAGQPDSSWEPSSRCVTLGGSLALSGHPLSRVCNERVG